MAILIKGGYVKPISGPDIPEGDILVDRGKIAAIGKKVKASANCKVIDAHGLIVTPGLIEAHCHLGLHGEASRWEGSDINERSNPVTPHMRAIDGFRPDDEAVGIALEAGITTAGAGPGSANVIGGTFAAFKLVGNDVDDMVLKSPVAMKIAFGENPKGCEGRGDSREGRAKEKQMKDQRKTQARPSSEEAPRPSQSRPGAIRRTAGFVVAPKAQHQQVQLRPRTFKHCEAWCGIIRICKTQS